MFLPSSQEGLVAKIVKFGMFAEEETDQSPRLKSRPPGALRFPGTLRVVLIFVGRRRL